MGRWAQYRHRGRGGSAPGVSFISPPVHPDEVSAYQDGTDVNAITTAPWPDGAVTAEFMWRQVPSSVWIEGVQIGVDTSVLLASGFTDGDEVEVRVRWLDVDSNPISDWGTTFSVLITP